MKESHYQAVRVKAPGRLHMGFVDLNGDLGRSFGSLGLCLENIYTEVRARHSDDIVCEGPGAERAYRYARQIKELTQFDGGVHIDIQSALEEHVGLGSGTQMCLAVSTAIRHLKGLEISLEEIVVELGRGARSGIGVGAFKYGGFLVDGGRGDLASVPPIISHLKFPESWRIVLIFDWQQKGVHGKEEKQAFRSLDPMDNRTANSLCRLMLMQVLPSLAEANFQGFGLGITRIQKEVGDFFAPMQGGRFQSKDVENTLEHMEKSGAYGVGQSSWGPTGFAVFESEIEAHQAVKKIRDNNLAPDSIELRICEARNEMAEVIVEEEEISSRISANNL